jgi:hypothetical protein
MMEKMLWITLLTLLIHGVETLTYGVRLAGVRTGKLAVALSLTGIIVLVSRTSNLLQAVMMGGVIDQAKLVPGFPLEWQMHILIAGASIGTLLAMLVFPTSVRFSQRLIRRLEVTGSLPKLLLESVSIRKLKNARRQLRRPTWEMLSRLRIGGVPKRLLLTNTLVTAIYTVGVLAALYASFRMPQFSTTASLSSGLINGVATILMTLLVDPQVALLTDKAMNGQENMASLNKMFGLLMFSRFCGTLLAQFILVPCALFIEWMLPFWR